MAPVALLPLCELNHFPIEYSIWNLPAMLKLNQLNQLRMIEMDTSPDKARTTLLKPAWNVVAGDNNTDTSDSHLSSHLIAQHVVSAITVSRGAERTFAD